MRENPYKRLTPIERKGNRNIKHIKTGWNIIRNFMRMGLMREAGNPEQKEIIIWWTAR